MEARRPSPCPRIQGLPIAHAGSIALTEALLPAATRGQDGLHAAFAGDHAQRWLCIKIRAWLLPARPWRGSPTTRGPVDNRAPTRRSGRLGTSAHLG